MLVRRVGNRWQWYGDGDDERVETNDVMAYADAADDIDEDYDYDYDCNNDDD